MSSEGRTTLTSLTRGYMNFCPCVRLLRYLPLLIRSSPRPHRTANQQRTCSLRPPAQQHKQAGGTHCDNDPAGPRRHMYTPVHLHHARLLYQAALQYCVSSCCQLCCGALPACPPPGILSVTASQIWGTIRCPLAVVKALCHTFGPEIVRLFDPLLPP